MPFIFVLNKKYKNISLCMSFDTYFTMKEYFQITYIKMNEIPNSQLSINGLFRYILVIARSLRISRIRIGSEQLATGSGNDPRFGQLEIKDNIPSLLNSNAYELLYTFLAIRCLKRITDSCKWSQIQDFDLLY